MFGSKNSNQFASGGHTLFDRAVEIDGNVKFSGTLDIEGKVNGDIVSSSGNDALVRVREHGVINGDIRAPKVIINGKVNGDVYASKHLEMADHAEVNGNVHYHVIEMVKGAHVNGSLVYEPAADESSKRVKSKVEPLKPESLKSEGAKAKA